MSGNLSNFSENAQDGPVSFSRSFQIFIYVIYNVVFVMALIGNSLVLYVVYSQPRMRSATNFLLVNLACGDLLICLLCVPFTIISFLQNFWPFGKVLCHLVSPANTVGVLVSSFTLVALALDRYVAIVHPFQPRLRKKYSVMVIAFIWSAAVLTASPIALLTRLKMDEKTELPVCYESEWPQDTQLLLAYTILLLVLQYVFPIIVLIFTYTRIGIIVWGKGQNVTPIDGQQMRRPIGKTVVVTFAVVVGYTAAWLPLNAFTVVDHMSHPPETEIKRYLFIGCHFIAMSHTTYNPFIYAWVNRTFREAFKIVFLNLMHNSCQTFRNPGKNGFLEHRGSLWQSNSSGRSNCVVNGTVRKVSTPLSTQTTNSVLTHKTSI